MMITKEELELDKFIESLSKEMTVKKETEGSTSLFVSYQLTNTIEIKIELDVKKNKDGKYDIYYYGYAQQKGAYCYHGMEGYQVDELNEELVFWNFHEKSVVEKFLIVKMYSLDHKIFSRDLPKIRFKTYTETENKVVEKFNENRGYLLSELVKEQHRLFNIIETKTIS